MVMFNSYFDIAKGHPKDCLRRSHELGEADAPQPGPLGSERRRSAGMMDDVTVVTPWGNTLGGIPLRENIGKW